jgi:hypothetical protein
MTGLARADANPTRSALAPVRSLAVPAIVTAAGERASMRFLEFFAANIRNPHTRRAYYRAAAAAMAHHASTRTTQLYDHRRGEVSLDEVGRIVT